MTHYNFKQLKSNGSGYGYCGINIGKRYITISNSFLEKLDGAKRIIVFYDVENKAIKITPTTNKEFSYRVRKGTSGTSIGIGHINRVMDEGRYYYKEDADGSFILVKNL